MRLLPTFGPALVGLAASAHAASASINYTTVEGYFLQDESSTDASTFDYTAVDFGLINRTFPADNDTNNRQTKTSWERLYHQVLTLNKESSRDVEYKVLFLGRHGEGWHNAAEEYYGTPAWNCYWAELDGNGTATWFDATLTTAGMGQALVAHNFWQKEINEQHIHTPDSYYVSPLKRTLQTANYTFTALNLPHGSTRFVSLIKELFREGISIHTCDHRHNRSYIHEVFPSWPIEWGFTEEDELWNGVTAETNAAQDARSRKALDSVFFSSTDPKQNIFVSVTSHSGEVASILRVLGHRAFSLNTGAVIPVLVRAEKLAAMPTASSLPWTVSPHCTVPPVTSVSACVCPSSAPLVTTPLVSNL